MTPLLWLTPAWLTGIFLADALKLTAPWLWLSLGLGGLVVAGIWSWAERQSGGLQLKTLWPLGLTALALGGLRLGLALPSEGPDGLSYYLNQPTVSVIGVVSAEPTYSQRSDTFRLSAEQVWLPDQAQPVAVSGDIYVRVASSVDVAAGDRLELTGQLAEPQEISGADFPYRQWLNRQGIYTVLDYPRTRHLAKNQEFFLNGWFRGLNQTTRELITHYLPGEEGGLLSGILLGDKSGVSATTRQEFTVGGVAHILVVSGSNISIAAGLLALLLGRFFGRRVVLGIVLSWVVFYVLLVGFSPPVARAGLMAILSIVAWLLGREQRAVNGLAVATLFMTLWQPYILLDLSFQLSALATLGLVLLARPLEAKLHDWPALIRESVVMTIAAELLTWPLIAFYFHQFSPFSLLTNLLVEPMLVVLTALGGLLVIGAGLLGWLPVIGPALAWVFAGPTWLGLAYMLVVIKICANLPGASLSLPEFHPVWLAVYYFLLSVALWWLMIGRKERRLRLLLIKMTSRPVLAGALVATLAVWLAAFAVFLL